MIRFGWLSSATPIGDMPTATSASTKEYSSATTLVGLPVIVVVPRSCLIVRVGLPHESRLTLELTPVAAAARSAFGAAPAAGDEDEAVAPQAVRAAAATVRARTATLRRTLVAERDMALTPRVEAALQGWEVRITWRRRGTRPGQGRADGRQDRDRRTGSRAPAG